MAASNVTEKLLLEKIQDLLERKPETCDVTFCVGKEKKIVRALKVILKASSPVLEKEFEEKWEVAVIKEGDGIPLPDFDPTAFELFVKLTSLDTWSLETLKKLNMPLTQVLNLLSICQRFEMTKAVENLKTLATTFLESFREYKDTDDFLQLSQKHLTSVLASDDIGIKELDVFHAAIRWAEFQCEEMKVEPTWENIREVLGDCIFEIRFPIMTSTEFTKTAESKDILTVHETVGIYRFIGLEAIRKLEFDAKKLPFKTVQRKQVQVLESKPNSETNSGEALLPSGISTLSLTRGIKIVNINSFVCDGSRNSSLILVPCEYFSISCQKEITLYGLGFLGPIENDGFYDVKVQITARGSTYYSGMLKKRIFAKKGKTFYFVFDAAIDIEPGSVVNWRKSYMIEYWLKGANTFMCSVQLEKPFTQQEGATEFLLLWKQNQLAEILFKLR